MIKLPYTFLPPAIISRGSRLFLGPARKLLPMFPFLGLNLREANMKERSGDYLAMCMFASLIFFVFISLILTVMLFAFRMDNAVIIGPIISLVFSIFVFVQQVLYPRMFSRKKIKSLEQNLLPALQNILVQLNSGVPIFNILTNIAGGDYGELSKEFDRAVRDINAGRNQIDALEELAANNPSTLFRRAIWQLVNGMKAGADMSVVMSEIIDALGEQQLIQIQNYGSQLSPLAMFYMLAAVIVPSLSVTFIIILSSFIALPSTITKMIFWGLLIFVIFVQIMFLGIIKSRRPNLLVA
ncbi:MAG: type II secretion system F family protein [Nanoarchaeota archaeon]|nr:type II secretion system F family protein [Nanoarchaeota archaeon]